MNDYSKFNLKDNPFLDITPPVPTQEDNEQIIWAGMPDLKQELEDIHRQAFTTASHQIVLNWGSVGAGKTHAAFYFANKTRLQSLVSDYEDEIFYVYVHTPQEGNSAVQQLYQDILDYLRLSKIKPQVQSIITALGQEKLLNFLSQRIGSEEFAKAILFLGRDKRNPLQPDFFNPEDSEFTEMMSRYFYGTATSAELKKLGLARPLNTVNDFVKILVGILLCLVGIPGGQRGRIFLWIDEMEDLLWFTQKQYRPFAQFLRDLFDQINEGLTIFMNFTLAEPNMDTIKMLLGEALWSRITKNVRFNELSVSDGMLYCKELLEPYQIEDKGEYSPFTGESLCNLLEMIQPAYMTPREINEKCSAVLNFALALEDITVISKEIVSKWFSQQQQENFE